MKRHRVTALIAVLVLVLAACTGDVTETSTTLGEEEPTTTAAEAPSTTAGEEPTTTAGGDEDPLAEYGESTDADPALVEKAMGPVADVPEIVLASIARASQELDQATIDKAIECYTNAVECETGTGGEVIMGYADGGGLNV
ncbi:MAG TPA: hypothetical protein VLS86_08840, partial [Acidimicrobiia bacterium]|nr:hypothetical protein [Acidimicrobiia bacterium]